MTSRTHAPTPARDFTEQETPLPAKKKTPPSPLPPFMQERMAEKADPKKKDKKAPPKRGAKPC